MRALFRFLVLPRAVSAFERNYLARVNRIAFVLLACHVPLFVLIAWLNDTRPLYAAVFSVAVMGGPVLGRQAFANPRHISILYGTTAMFMGGLLVHFGQGPVQIEMHFYFFALLAMCAVFGNPLVIVAAALTVTLHHLLVWLVLPKSVFNYQAAWWVVALHATFVVLESVAACFISRSFFDSVIGLEKIVRARTRELDEKNRGLRMLLDSAEQGFLKIDESGSLASEYSAAVDVWFGTPLASQSWFDFLATLSPEFAESTRLAWAEVVEGVMPTEVTLAQMPSRLAFGAAHYRFEYRPIGNTPQQKYLVIVTDVTTVLARENAELERREAMTLFERVLEDRWGFEEFATETSQVVEVLLHARESAVVVKRLIHTLKGNASLYGLLSIATQCHLLEDAIAETGALPSTSAYAPLAQRWASLAAEIQVLLGAPLRTVDVSEEQCLALESAVRAGESGSTLLKRIRALRLEPSAKRLKRFQEHATRIAQRLDKGEVQVEIRDHGVRLERKQWSGFWSAFGHAVRNSLDHGIEPMHERVAAGKPATGKITLSTYEEHGTLVVEIADDGRGIDWRSVAERAERAGLPTESALELERALFVDGISTARQVTDLSGRGIGMGALLSATRALGGILKIQSALNRGTMMRFVFPDPAPALFAFGANGHERPIQTGERIVFDLEESKR